MLGRYSAHESGATLVHERSFCRLCDQEWQGVPQRPIPSRLKVFSPAIEGVVVGKLHEDTIALDMECPTCLPTSTCRVPAIDACLTWKDHTPNLRGWTLNQFATLGAWRIEEPHSGFAIRETDQLAQAPCLIGLSSNFNEITDGCHA